MTDERRNKYEERIARLLIDMLIEATGTADRRSCYAVAEAILDAIEEGDDATADRVTGAQR